MLLVAALQKENACKAHLRNEFCTHKEMQGALAKGVPLTEMGTGYKQLFPASDGQCFQLAVSETAIGPGTKRHVKMQCSWRGNLDSSS